MFDVPFEKFEKGFEQQASPVFERLSKSGHIDHKTDIFGPVFRPPF